MGDKIKTKLRSNLFEYLLFGTLGQIDDTGPREMTVISRHNNSLNSVYYVTVSHDH